MKYKEEDQVLVKGTIKSTGKGIERYLVNFGGGAELWFEESEIQLIQKQFPREMWVWDEGKAKQKKEVSFIHSDINVSYPVLVVYVYETGEMDTDWFEFAEEIEPIYLSLSEAKKIIAEAKGVDESEINILNS